MLLLKQHRKILRYIYHKKTVSYPQLSQKFPTENLNDFLRSKYVKVSPPVYNNYGEPVPFSANTLVQLSPFGIAEIEAHQWFNLQYVITQILVPIAIALCTYALTCSLGKHF